MLIVQISDTHITGPGLKTCGVAPMAENLARCVDSINSLNPKPDLVLLSGDVTNDCTQAQAQQAARLLSKLECPFYLVPGNHDNQSGLPEAISPCQLHVE